MNEFRNVDYLFYSIYHQLCATVKRSTDAQFNPKEARHFISHQIMWMKFEMSSCIGNLIELA